MRRFLKQLGFGFFYLILLGIVLGISYLILRPSETCFDGIQNQNEVGIDCGDVCGIDCELKYIQSLVVSQPLIFKGGGLVSFMAQVKNPNPSYGTDRFDYQINFYDAQDNLLKSLDRISFIYANETKNIIEAGVKISGYVNRGELAISSERINWKHFSEWQKPILETAGVKSTLGKDTVTINGTIKNPNNFLISEINIGAILKDKWGTSLGISKIELNDLRPLQGSNFQIFIPVDQDSRERLDLTATEILIEAKK